MTWRDIPCRVVNWGLGLNDQSYRATRAVWRLSSSNGPWSAFTLGDVADMGERRWRREPGIGDKAVLVIKRTIDLAAAGNIAITKVVAADAYVPECERNEENER